eukprot:1133651-Heterocapsa_arctica.AAC.1
MHFHRLRSAAQALLMIRASLPPGSPGPPYNVLLPSDSGIRWHTAGGKRKDVWAAGSPLVVRSPGRLALCFLSGESIVSTMWPPPVLSRRSLLPSLRVASPS